MDRFRRPALSRTTVAGMTTRAVAMQRTRSRPLGGSMPVSPRGVPCRHISSRESTALFNNTKSRPLEGSMPVSPRGVPYDNTARESPGWASHQLAYKLDGV
eukprot:1138227-Pelagomonas_calceolata.AAC.1